MPEQIGGLALALAAFPLFLWVPGASLGYAVNLLDFRSRSVPVRLALGLLISLCCCPIVTYFLVRFGGFSAAFGFFGVVWIVALSLAIRNAKGLVEAAALLFRRHWGVLVVCGAWIVAGGISEIDFLMPAGVMRSLNTGDAAAHVAFTNALTRTGIPPVNPFIFPGHPVHLFYYYFWYMMCSLVDQLGGSLVDARAAVQAGAIFSGFAVFAAITVYVEFFGPLVAPGRRLRTGVALALVTITGLDLLPWIFEDFLFRVFGKGNGAGLSIEWWNEQVTAWLGAVVMSPHHPVGMAICFSSLLFAVGAVWKTEGRQRIWAIAVSALGFASAAGVSLYVTFAFGAGIGIWIWVAFLRGWRKYIWPLAIAGVIAGLLYLPFATELRSASQFGKSPVALTIRAFTPVDYWLPSILRFLKQRPDIIMLLRLVCLPLNYFLELGFFFVCAVFYWRWRRAERRSLAPEEVLLACIAAGSILICTFLRSTFRWNDLGWRGFLVAQFVLLLWAVPVAMDLVERRGTAASPSRRLVLWACALIGFAGTVGELGSMRINFEGPHGPDTLGWRAAYQWVDRNAPPDAVVLLNGDVALDLFSSLYGYRQVVAVGRAYATFFAVGDWSEKVLSDTAEFYRHDRRASDLVDFCRRYGITIVVVLSEDPIWSDRKSWVWRLRPAMATGTARVFRVEDLARMEDRS
ncbi:MAG TPA: hypothetical protein VKB79_21295 [Bryobacteraceae bacterium]|nr:hypothetical protein [Bryobacteraceae bacterium]